MPHNDSKKKHSENSVADQVMESTLDVATM